MSLINREQAHQARQFYTTGHRSILVSIRVWLSGRILGHSGYSEHTH